MILSAILPRLTAMKDDDIRFGTLSRIESAAPGSGPETPRARWRAFRLRWAIAQFTAGRLQIVPGTFYALVEMFRRLIWVEVHAGQNPDRRKVARVKSRQAIRPNDHPNLLVLRPQSGWPHVSEMNQGPNERQPNAAQREQSANYAVRSRMGVEAG